MVCGHLRAEHRAHAAIHVRDIGMEADGFEVLARAFGVGDEQRRIERFGQRVGCLRFGEEVRAVRHRDRATEFDLRLHEQR